MMKGIERETVKKTDGVQMRNGENKCGGEKNLTDRQIESGRERSSDWSHVPFPPLPSHHRSPIQLTRFASFITLSVPLSVSLQ